MQRTMRRVLAAATTVVLLIFPGRLIAAALHRASKPHAVTAMALMENDLNLSGAQRKQVAAAEQSRRKKLSAIRANHSLTELQRSAQTEAANNAARAAFVKVLTQAQSNKYYSLLSKQMMERYTRMRSASQPRAHP